MRDRRADVALGPRATSRGPRQRPLPAAAHRRRRRAVAPRWPATARCTRRRCGPSAGPCGPEASDPATPLATLVARLGVPAPSALRAHPSHAAALAAVASGEGVAAALAHTVTDELAARRARAARRPRHARGSRCGARRCCRSTAARRAATFGRFVATPDATQAILARSAGTAASRFRPAVYVTIWATDAASS